MAEVIYESGRVRIDRTTAVVDGLTYAIVGVEVDDNDDLEPANA